MVKLVVDKYQRGEKTVFLENVKSVLKMYEGHKLVLIFDRGYICLSLLLELEKLDVKYLFRVPGNCFKKEIETAKSDDSKIRIEITKARLQSMEAVEQKAFLERGYKEERLLKVPLDTGEIEYLLTNLHEKEASYEEFKDLYYKRWNIMPISALCSLCRYFFNADFLIFTVKICYLYDKYRHYYFSPLSLLNVSSSSAYLNVTSSLKTESPFSSSFLCA